MKKHEEQRLSSRASSRPHLYNNFPWPCRSALNLPYSLRYLAHQSLEPHALPGVARAPRYEPVHHRKIGGVSQPPPRSILTRLECDEPGPLLLNYPFAGTNWRRRDRPKRAASESTSGRYCRREDKHGGYNYLRAPVWYCKRGFCLTVSPGTAEGAGIECQGRYYDGFTHRGRAATEPGR
jgi:hypothetical protein